MRSGIRLVRLGAVHQRSGARSSRVPGATEKEQMRALRFTRRVHIHLKLAIVSSIGRHAHTTSAGLPSTGRIARPRGCQMDVAPVVTIRCSSGMATATPRPHRRGAPRRRRSGAEAVDPVEAGRLVALRQRCKRRRYPCRHPTPGDPAHGAPAQRSRSRVVLDQVELPPGRPVADDVSQSERHDYIRHRHDDDTEASRVSCCWSLVDQEKRIKRWARVIASASPTPNLSSGGAR